MGAVLGAGSHTGRSHCRVTTTATDNGDLEVGFVNCEQPNDVLDPIAWFCGNSGDTIHVVGTRTRNAFGLFDMLGNVMGWCHDWFEEYSTDSVTDPWGPPTGTYRLMRGGTYRNAARFSRAAMRNRIEPTTRNRHIGFRPVRTYVGGN